ncbi:hypothetical protein CHARACLAT_024981 [Characodon lateralis]|uniref:Uncharacterized protein n=1 Tax=Characodon lateralis TaxID=208331 RepID=A0ABU7EM71_9TELE|nr:hypothetical protein [Characodon lateralis]
MSLCRAAGVTGSVISICQRVGLPQAFQDRSPWRQVKGRSAIAGLDEVGLRSDYLNKVKDYCFCSPGTRAYWPLHPPLDDGTITTHDQ